MSKKTEELLAADQVTAKTPTPPTREELDKIRLTLMIPALPALTFYSPSVQIGRLEEKINEIAMKFNTLVNMLMGTVVEK